MNKNIYNNNSEFVIHPINGCPLNWDNTTFFTELRDFNE